MPPHPRCSISRNERRSRRNLHETVLARRDVVETPQPLAHDKNQLLGGPGTRRSSMSKNPAPVALRPIHPLHAMLVALPLPMFLGALFSDLAYTRTFQVQWLNFASLLIV